MTRATAAAQSRPGAAPQGGAQPIIQFDGVVKAFGHNVVLNRLDFSVARGEKVSIVGPSGSGKSTVLRILMTLETISDGVVRVDGEPLWHEQSADGALVAAGEKHLRRMRKKMGMVFQQFNLFPHMTVLRNLTEAPMRVLGLSKKQARERAMEHLAWVDMRSHASKVPRQLSGGQ